MGEVVNLRRFRSLAAREQERQQVEKLVTALRSRHDKFQGAYDAVMDLAGQLDPSDRRKFYEVATRLAQERAEAAIAERAMRAILDRLCC